MEDKVEVLTAISDEAVQEKYHEIIAQDQEQTRSRAQQLAILPDEAKHQIALASQYSSYFPNPITKPFMRKYILAKLEFPTKGSELSQSLTELNVRIDNLFNDAYMYKKADIESRKADLKVRQLQKELETAEDDLHKEEILLEIESAEAEKANKLVSLNKIKLAAMARYNEAMGWKGCVEDIMQEMGVKSIDDVDFNRVRMDEMEAKIKRWGELHAQGALELTPSKFQAIDSNQEAFVSGVQEGHQKRLEIEHQQKELQKQLESLNASKSAFK